MTVTSKLNEFWRVSLTVYVDNSSVPRSPGAQSEASVPYPELIVQQRSYNKHLYPTSPRTVRMHEIESIITIFLEFTTFRAQSPSNASLQQTSTPARNVQMP
jgi:hypothetical protein